MVGNGYQRAKLTHSPHGVSVGREFKETFMRLKRFCIAFGFLVPSIYLHALVLQQAYVKASNTGVNDSFGHSVAISGDTMVVGAPYEDSGAIGINGNSNDNSKTNSGAVYVYVRSGNTWAQQAYIKASNPDEEDQFGWSVAISGDTLVVGALNESSSATGVNGNQSLNNSLSAGAAYVFIRNGTNWNQQAYLKASNTGAGDLFGYSVAIDGETIVVGSPYEGSAATGIDGNQFDNSALYSGAAYVFTRSGTVWTQQAYLKASNTGTNDTFGAAVAISSNTVAVAAIIEGSSSAGINGNQLDNSIPGAGAVYVYTRSGTFWSQQAYIKASNPNADDVFGFGLALDGNTLAVGAFHEDSGSAGVNGNQVDNTLTNSGAAYVFVRNGTTWSQQAYLKASNPHADDIFGLSLAVQGDNLVVSSWNEPSSATGINGSQTNSAAPGSGAAYLFRRSGTNWNQSAYIKASNTGSNDAFSTDVAMSGDTLVIGAENEASNATGINGSQSDNSASGAGAAYVFVNLSGSAGPAVTIVPAGYFVRFTGVPNASYEIQRAPAVDGPWTTIATVIAPVSGFVEYHDANPPPGKSFYRTLQ